MTDSASSRVYPRSVNAARFLLAGFALCVLAACVEAPPPRPYYARPAPPPAPPANTEVYAYPQQNQTADQTDRDRYECHEWAVQQTNFDPSAPGTPPQQQIHVVAGPPPGTNTAIGAVTGAILGAVLAGPRSSGAGALFGAVAGGAVGAAGDAANAQNVQAQVQAQTSAADARQNAIAQQKASDYRRAISACLEGRGYTVK